MKRVRQREMKTLVWKMECTVQGLLLKVVTGPEVFLQDQNQNEF